MYFTEAEAILGLSSPYTAEDLKSAWKAKSKEFHPEAGGRGKPGHEALFKRASRARDLLVRHLDDPSYVQDSRPGDPDYRVVPGRGAVPPQPPGRSKPVPPQPPGRGKEVPPQPPPRQGPPPPPPPPEGYRTGRPAQQAKVSGRPALQTAGQGGVGSDIFGRRTALVGMPVSISEPIRPTYVEPQIRAIVGQRLRVSSLLLDGRPVPAPWRYSSWVALTSGRRGGRLAVAFQPPSPLPSSSQVEASVSFEEDDPQDFFSVSGPVVERSYVDKGLVSLLLVEVSQGGGRRS